MKQRTGRQGLDLIVVFGCGPAAPHRANPRRYTYMEAEPQTYATLGLKPSQEDFELATPHSVRTSKSGR
jgi:hypothetical protein